LKVNVMSTADRPIPQAANAHQRLNPEGNERGASG
jgi:hypothetical protein